MSSIKSNPPERVFYFDFLRVAAIIAVIAIHTTSPRTAMELGSSTWKGLTFYANIITWAVPVFVMISGALFLDPDREIGATFLSKKIFRMILAFLFWSPLYAVFDTYIYNPTSVRQNLFGLAARIFLGHSHLWFLFMIVGLYLIVPLVRKITQDWKLVKYFLALSVLFTFVFPFVLWGLKVVDFVLAPSDSLYEFADQVYSKLHFHFTLGYLPFFVGGYFLHNANISKRTEYAIYVLALLSAVLSILYAEFGSLYAGKDLLTMPHLPDLFQPMAVFVFARKHVNNFGGERFQRVISFGAKHSFGVYLVHYFVLICFVWLIFDTTAFNSLFSVPVIVAAVYFLSTVLAFGLSKVPVIRRYFI